MKKLLVKDIKMKAALQAKLCQAKEEAEQAIDDASHTIEAAVAVAQTALENYNEVIKEVEEWREGIHSEMEEYEGERSDKWREGDAGSSYSDWMQAWSEEVSEIPELEVPILELPDFIDESKLDEWPDEPS